MTDELNSRGDRNTMKMSYKKNMTSKATATCALGSTPNATTGQGRADTSVKGAGKQRQQKPWLQGRAGAGAGAQLTRIFDSRTCSRNTQQTLIPKTSCITNAQGDLRNTNQTITNADAMHTAARLVWVTRPMHGTCEAERECV
jgi:hypothetical protein